VDNAKQAGGLQKTVKPAKSRDDRGRIWRKDGNYVRPVEVRIVATDGTLSEVAGPEAKEDMEVVIGEEVASTQGSDTTNPFAPKTVQGRRPQEQAIAAREASMELIRLENITKTYHLGEVDVPVPHGRLTFHRSRRNGRR